MMCGRPPFTGRPNAVIRRHLVERPRPIRDMSPGTPPKIGAVLARALQKTPDDRYPTAGAFMAALLGGAPRVRVVGRRIAVIPFVNATDGMTVDAFSDSVSEQVSAALREFEGIVVAPPVEVHPLDLDGHVSHVARRTRGDVVLFGNVRRSPDRAELSISATLFDARTGRRIWAGSSVAQHRDEPGGVSPAAGSTARAIATALGIRAATDHPNDYGLGARADSSCRSTSPSRRISAP